MFGESRTRLQSMLASCGAGSFPSRPLLPLPSCSSCCPKRWGRRSRLPSSPPPACTDIRATARLHGQGGASTEPCFQLPDRLCKASDFQSPDVWIYGLRLVPSSHPSRGLADSQARGLTLHRGFSSRVHGGQHEPGSNPTATSARGAGAAG